MIRGTSRAGLKKSESVLTVGEQASSRPIANALFIQNINPLKKKKNTAEDENGDEMIAGGGEKVSLTDNMSGTANENAKGSQPSSMMSKSR